MRVVITHSTTKRQIDGAFELCGSRADLESIARQILGHLAASENFSYGWISILPTGDRQASFANTPPKGWDA